MIVAPLVCGTLGQRVAWHWGFGAAGVGMLLGLAVYLSGRRWLPAETARGATARARRPRLTRAEWAAVALLLGLLPVMAIEAVGNQQIFNAYLVWGDANFGLRFFGQTLPVTWLLSMDAFISTGMLVLVVAFWRLWGRWRREPDEIVKMVIGASISALAPLLLALASAQQHAAGHKISLAWGIGFHVVNDVGFAMVFPVGLALFSRVSPRAIGGLMIGVYYIHLFAANMIVGRLGGMLETLGATAFWILHAGLVATGAAIMLLFALLFRHILAPADRPAPVNGARTAQRSLRS